MGGGGGGEILPAPHNSVIAKDMGLKRICEVNPAGENSSFIFTACIEFVPLYHFKLAYVVLRMGFKEYFESHF